MNLNYKNDSTFKYKFGSDQRIGLLKKFYFVKMNQNT